MEDIILHIAKNKKASFEHNLSKDGSVFITGEVAQGKSTLIKQFIEKIKATYKDDTSLILVDVKHLEFEQYKEERFCYNNHIFAEIDEIISITNELKEELERRRCLFADLGVDNINEYNNLPNVSPLKRLIFVCDDIGYFKFGYKKVIHQTIYDFAVLGKELGIYYIIAYDIAVPIRLPSYALSFGCRILFNNQYIKGEICQYLDIGEVLISYPNSPTEYVKGFIDNV